MTRRNWLLQQLGIKKWKLRCPAAVLPGAIAFTTTLPDHIRLLLVAYSLPPVDHQLVVDVARSMAITPAQIYRVTPKQVMLLQQNSVRCYCWWLGLDVLRNFAGISFNTPPLAVLSSNVGAKCELWHRISTIILHTAAISCRLD
ncbi:DNA polymerase III subunit psi [Candidatus Moranella endobia PCVAL]|uniref:DNA polymerase III subunit psi n=1 Tax=Moranella endobia (strain PCIT) TaxID=903503 RepID=F7XXT2_MOREP|nr:DNA polymerase III subunit psi [Candidatus Moranella endobia]AEI74908.1 putative DNA polymerase III subunit psi [Candidatus Moranella endobia PCIT]AGJ61155.1 DNA polymerase III subunit psi [Candidatus Moranella endobia PCVAL]